MAKSIHTVEYQNVLKKLKGARNESGFTQVEISQKLKKPQSYISKIERGERRIDITELSVIAKIYKKPLDFFVK
jgi:transcriptional regulator with XRE-family HTH domain